MEPVSQSGSEITPTLFSPEALRLSAKRTFDEATAALPPDAKGAVMIDATGKRVSAVLIAKIAENDKVRWVVLGEAAYDDHHVEGHVATALTWR